MQGRLYQHYRDIQRYIGWDESDEQNILLLLPKLIPHTPDLISDFYNEIGKHPNASQSITGGEEQILRLKKTLEQWFRELLRGPYNEEYVSKRWKIGNTHVESGVDQIYLIASVSRMRWKLSEIVVEEFGEENHCCSRLMDSLNKLLDLDLAIIEDSYQAERVVRTQIADRLESERSLQIREARLAAIVNTTVDGIITIDEMGTIETFNPAAERIFGYRAEETIGQNVAMLMPDPYTQEHDAYLSSYRETGVEKIIGKGREVKGLTKDGRIFDMELSVSEVTVDDRRFFTGIVRDISERKRTEEKLLQSERLAAIGKAMTGLAHESRNALQRSQANLEMLIRRVQHQPEAIDLTNRIQIAQDDLHRLYEEVREYASPIRLSFQICDVGKLIREAWNNLSIRRNGRVIDFQEQEHPSEGRRIPRLKCQADPFAMQRVFRNVLENTLAACEDPVEIEIHYTSKIIRNVPSLEIRIADNGPGFDSEVRERIFEEFFTTKTHGTGLGMAICKRYVEAHQGTIDANSGESGCAEIIMTLPEKIS